MPDILILVPEITKGMKSVGSKALLHIKNSVSVLQYQIDQIKKYDKHANIFIGTGFESEKIKKIFKSYHKNLYFIENPEYSRTNQAYILGKFAQEYSSNQLLVISNGILFKNNPFKMSDESKIFLIDKPKYNFTIGCSESDDIHYLFYDLPIAWSECVSFNRMAVNCINHINKEINISQMYLFELINLLIEKHNIHFDRDFINKKNIMKINSTKDISKAKVFI